VTIHLHIHSGGPPDDTGDEVDTAADDAGDEPGDDDAEDAAEPVQEQLDELDEQLDAMMSYLGLEWCEGCADFHEPESHGMGFPGNTGLGPMAPLVGP
jgi:hypothetical protein